MIIVLIGLILACSLSARNESAPIITEEIETVSRDSHQTSLAKTATAVVTSTQPLEQTQHIKKTLEAADSSTFTAVSPPTFTPRVDVTGIEYQAAFGIDYRHPNLYLAQGEQSHISDPSMLDGLTTEEHGLVQLEAIYRWLQSEFVSYSAGGKTIGTVTVDQLLQERRLGGCHDYSLVYAAVARELGYPAIMARSNSIAWVKQFQAGEHDIYIGHVFVEVYLHNTWVLIDPTNGWYLDEGYDPANPVVPLQGHITGTSAEIYGFYMERKGIDTWDFGIFSQADSAQAMDDFAHHLDLNTITYPDYGFDRFTK